MNVSERAWVTWSRPRNIRTPDRQKIRVRQRPAATLNAAVHPTRVPGGRGSAKSPDLSRDNQEVDFDWEKKPSSNDQGNKSFGFEVLSMSETTRCTSRLIGFYANIIESFCDLLSLRSH